MKLRETILLEQNSELQWLTNIKLHDSLVNRWLLCWRNSTNRKANCNTHHGDLKREPHCFIREFKKPRRRQQKPHKFAYLTMKNSIFARFARAFFMFWHFEDVLVLSTTWNDLFFRCVDDISIWWHKFNFVHLCPKRWFQFNSSLPD